VIRHHDDSNPAHSTSDLGDVTGFAQRRCLFDADGSFPGVVPQRPHDFSGLGDGLRLRLETGVGLEIVWETTGTVR